MKIELSDFSDSDYSEEDSDESEEVSDPEQSDSDSNCSENPAYYDEDYGKLIKPGGRLDKLIKYVVDCVNLLMEPRFLVVFFLKLIEALNFIDPQISLVSFVRLLKKLLFYTFFFQF